LVAASSSDEVDHPIESYLEYLRVTNEVVIARDSAEAIDLIKEGGKSAFALMIIEYSLPGMGGLEVIKFAKEHSRDEAKKPFIAMCEPEGTIIMGDGSNQTINYPHDLDQIRSVCVKSGVLTS